MEEAAKLGIEPLLGIRVRLYSLGKGKWQNTGGEKSKFGLSAAQALHMIEHLQAAGKLDCLQLLHFHMGSQIANIQDIQRGMREASRYFAELHRLGANIRVVDVGGGLGVDYDGSRSRNVCSINYSLQEYANTIVRSVQDVCEEYELPFPDFISESGRGLTAHHAVLITNVIDTDPEQPETVPELREPDDADPMILHNLFRLYHNRKQLPPSEIYHDAAYWLDDAHGMYAHGSIDLNQRARAEEFHRAICRKLLSQPELFDALEPEIQSSLQEKLADKYFCNFSLFQSMPDAWAIAADFPHHAVASPARKPGSARDDAGFDLRFRWHGLPLRGERALGKHLGAAFAATRAAVFAGHFHGGGVSGNPRRFAQPVRRYRFHQCGTAGGWQLPLIRTGTWRYH